MVRERPVRRRVQDAPRPVQPFPPCHAIDLPADGYTPLFVPALVA
jgi:hypothetical protein